MIGVGHFCIFIYFTHTYSMYNYRHGLTTGGLYIPFRVHDSPFFLRIIYKDLYSMTREVNVFKSCDIEPLEEFG